MRIGMLGPVSHPYPPPAYGPWERVTHDLTEALVAAGHEVTLFAPAGSRTSARHMATIDSTLEVVPDELHRELEDLHVDIALSSVAELDLDVVHSHLHIHVLDHAYRPRSPMVSTLHGVAWNTDLHEALRRHSNANFVSLSDRERAFLPELNYVETVPNGINCEEFPPGTGTGGYVVFVGRLAPEKAPHLAVETARRAGVPVLIAGVIEEKHRDYANQLLGELGSDGDYLGPLGREDISMLYADALATVMPLGWDEPFGLVVVESLASGTPVVAWNRGAMPEIIDDGKTGYLVRDVDEAARAVSSIPNLSRSDCARTARERFDRSVMAGAYARVYERLATTSPRSARRHP